MYCKYLNYFLMLLILGMLLISSISYAQTVAGKILASRGEAYAISQQGRRNLNRGDNVYAGDRLHTGSDSRLLIRYTDNSAVALKANSQLTIKTYEYNPGNRNTNQFLRGSMRMLTGKISKNNPKGFQVKTPVAVIGVRGTEFHLTLTCQSGNHCKLRAVTTKGVITVTNNTGTISLPTGQMVTVESATSPLSPVQAPKAEMCFGG